MCVCARAVFQGGSQKIKPASQLFSSPSSCVCRLLVHAYIHTLVTSVQDSVSRRARPPPLCARCLFPSLCFAFFIISPPFFVSSQSSVYAYVRKCERRWWWSWCFRPPCVRCLLVSFLKCCMHAFQFTSLFLVRCSCLVIFGG